MQNAHPLNHFHRECFACLIGCVVHGEILTGTPAQAWKELCEEVANDIVNDEVHWGRGWGDIHRC